LKGNVGFQLNSRSFGRGYVATLAANENYNSSMLTVNTLNPQGELDSYTTTDIRISLSPANDQWQLDLFGTNVFNKAYYVAGLPQVLGAAMGINNPGTNPTTAAVNNNTNAPGDTVFNGWLGDPARFGIRFSVKF
jgi:iron complex outermembrane receptor protein